MKVDPRSLPTFGARSEAAQRHCPKLSYTTTDSKWSAGYVDRHWTAGCVDFCRYEPSHIAHFVQRHFVRCFHPESMPGMRLVLSKSLYAAASSVSVDALTGSYEVQGERKRWSNFSFWFVDRKRMCSKRRKSIWEHARFSTVRQQCLTLLCAIG